MTTIMAALPDEAALPQLTASSRALGDMALAMKQNAIWRILAWQDIKQRYRRSVLGPFWLTISTAIMIGALAFVYGGLFHQSLDQYLPFVACGMIVWTLIAAIVNESCTVFIAAEGVIKQVRLPLTLHVCRMVWRNMLIFLHNAVILLLLYICFGHGLALDLLSLPLALVVYAINGVWLGLVLGSYCTRFRDIAPIVANMVQLLFFVTPIMWRPEVLGADRAWVAAYNPLFHFIELVRAPILGEAFPLLSWQIAITISLLGMILAVLTLTGFRHRVAYWL